MTPENKKYKTLAKHLENSLTKDSISLLLEEDEIIEVLPSEPVSAPPEKEVDQDPQGQKYPNNILDNPQITSLKNLPGVVKGFPPGLLTTVLYQRSPEATKGETTAARVNLPDRTLRPKKRTFCLPGKELITPGDELKTRLWVRERRAKAIRKAVFCLVTEIPAKESISRAARRILRKKEQGNEESEAKACARVREDLRWFLKHLRPYQENRVYQVFGQEEDQQEVNPLFKNPEWQKTYQAILTHFGSLSVYEFMLQLNDLLHRGYSYL